MVVAAASLKESRILLLSAVRNDDAPNISGLNHTLVIISHEEERRIKSDSRGSSSSLTPNSNPNRVFWRRLRCEMNNLELGYNIQPPPHIRPTMCALDNLVRCNGIMRFPRAKATSWRPYMEICGERQQRQEKKHSMGNEFNSTIIRSFILGNAALWGCYLSS